jgi:hypothetical protein
MAIEEGAWTVVFLCLLMYEYNELRDYYLSKFRLSFMHSNLSSGDVATSVLMTGWLSLLSLNRTESTVHCQRDISITRGAMCSLSEDTI